MQQSLRNGAVGFAILLASSAGRLSAVARADSGTSAVAVDPASYDAAVQRMQARKLAGPTVEERLERLESRAQATNVSLGEAHRQIDQLQAELAGTRDELMKTQLALAALQTQVSNLQGPRRAPVVPPVPVQPRMPAVIGGGVAPTSDGGAAAVQAELDRVNQQRAADAERDRQQALQAEQARQCEIDAERARAAQEEQQRQAAAAACAAAEAERQRQAAAAAAAAAAEADRQRQAEQQKDKDNAPQQSEPFHHGRFVGGSDATGK